VYIYIYMHVMYACLCYFDLFLNRYKYSFVYDEHKLGMHACIYKYICILYASMYIDFYKHIYIYIYIYVCVCVCACVRVSVYNRGPYIRAPIRALSIIMIIQSHPRTPPAQF
jgi:hypothetical protein